MNDEKLKKEKSNDSSRINEQKMLLSYKLFDRNVNANTTLEVLTI